MRICSTAFAKHMLPVFTRPRGRIFIAAAKFAEDPDGPSLSRCRSSLRFAVATDAPGVDDAATPVAAGTEIPTTFDTGRRGLDVEAAVSDGWKSDVHDFLGRLGTLAAGVGAEEVEATGAADCSGGGCGAVGSFSFEASAMAGGSSSLVSACGESRDFDGDSTAAETEVAHE